MAMHGEVTPFLTRLGRNLGTVVLGLLIAEAGLADDDKPVAAVNADSPLSNMSKALAATSTNRNPLNLLLTRAELLAVVRSYEARTGENLTAPIRDEDQVTVVAPVELAPMHDPVRDVGGGLFAPFWALLHPTQAWRIFAPIPPSGPAEEAKPIRAEDRPYTGPMWEP
jgi:hypothetical protein